MFAKAKKGECYLAFATATLQHVLLCVSLKVHYYQLQICFSTSRDILNIMICPQKVTFYDVITYFLLT